MRPVATEDRIVRRVRITELTSSLGALVLGVGLGAIFSRWLADVALWMLLAGAAAHAWGMYDKNRIERDVGGPDVWWHIYAYRLCWILLAAGAVVLAVRALI